MREVILESDRETFAQIFAYSIRKKDHEKMLSVMRRLGRIHKNHGSLEMRLYVWGEEAFLHGFDEIGKLLGVSSNDDLWLEINCYEDSSQQKKALSLMKRDRKALIAWEELQKLTGPGRTMYVGEFDRLSVGRNYLNSSKL